MLWSFFFFFNPSTHFCSQTEEAADVKKKISFRNSKSDGTDLLPYKPNNIIGSKFGVNMCKIKCIFHICKNA